MVHEYGHYRMARACGVKVLRFSVGFGRVVWRHQKTPDSTEFVLSALPLGGYVRMLDEREAAVTASELPQAFNRKPLWQRSAIVAAGPAANLLLAVLLYACVHWIGMDEPKALLGSPPAGSLAERAGLRCPPMAKIGVTSMPCRHCAGKSRRLPCRLSRCRCGCPMRRAWGSTGGSWRWTH